MSTAKDRLLRKLKDRNESTNPDKVLVSTFTPAQAIESLEAAAAAIATKAQKDPFGIANRDIATLRKQTKANKKLTDVEVKAGVIKTTYLKANLSNLDEILTKLECYRGNDDFEDLYSTFIGSVLNSDINASHVEVLVHHHVPLTIKFKSTTSSLCRFYMTSHEDSVVNPEVVRALQGYEASVELIRLGYCKQDMSLEKDVDISSIVGAMILTMKDNTVHFDINNWIKNECFPDSWCNEKYKGNKGLALMMAYLSPDKSNPTSLGSVVADLNNLVEDLKHEKAGFARPKKHINLLALAAEFDKEDGAGADIANGQTPPTFEDDPTAG